MTAASGRLSAIGALVGVVIALLVPGVAHADAAGPTDYRTQVEAIEPSIDGLAVSIEGGDAFIRLTAPVGSEVIVFGYVGEPYLRFSPDGTVAQNLRSAATYENEERYGGVDLPDIVDPAAEPEWETVATGGVWAWHDHRSHWMGDRPPIGLDRGATLPAQTVPISVDGTPVGIVVSTTFVESPSWVAPAFGALIGLQLALIGVWLGLAVSTFVTMLLAAAALLVGAAQYRSLPAETGPLLTWWLVPALALACGLATIALYGRSRIVEIGLLMVAALQLGTWAVLRRSGLTSAVLPTDLAFWFDRAVTAAVLVAAPVLLFGALRSLMSLTSPPAV